MKSKNTPVIIICSLLLVTAFSCLLWIYCRYQDLTPDASAAMTADIYQNGTLLKSIPLDPQEPPYTMTVMGENGAYNTITVQEGKIGISAASCPDKLCMHQGFINNSLLPITCLPNKLVIRVRQSNPSVENSEASMADIITY